MAAVSGIASADEVISYTTTLNPTTTDITNSPLFLTAWNPGGTGTYNTIQSDSALPTLMTNGPTLTAGVTMASLSTPGIGYVLQSYDIFITSTVSGTFSVTNTNTTPGTVSGTADVTSYTAVSLGSTMGALTSSTDPTNDLFYKTGGVVPGYGASVATAQQNINLSQGQSTGNVPLSNGAAGADYGLNEFLGGSNGVHYFSTTNGLSSVKQASPLDFYVSSLTNVTTSLTGASDTTAKSTSVSESVTVFYDFTTTTTSSATPEPTTMVLFGSALVGLGLLRKRARQS
jgi:hypothetical protein